MYLDGILHLILDCTLQGCNTESSIRMLLQEKKKKLISWLNGHKIKSVNELRGKTKGGDGENGQLKVSSNVFIKYSKKKGDKC